MGDVPGNGEQLGELGEDGASKHLSECVVSSRLVFPRGGQPARLIDLGHAGRPWPWRNAAVGWQATP